jgi:hypothetical protein
MLHAFRGRGLGYRSPQDKPIDITESKVIDSPI